MFASWAAVLTPPLLIVPTMGCLSYWGRTLGVQQSELPRKVLHIAFGICSLLFPLFLHETWTILASLSLVFTWLFAVRQLPALRDRFGCVLHSIKRRSGGEFYFAVSLAILLIVSAAAPLYFIIPMLTLTFADSFAAIAGQRWPRTALSGVFDGKTLTGSSVFLITAFFCCYLPLVFITDLPGGFILWVSVLMAVSTCLTEALSKNGSDNLFIPAVACMALYCGGVPVAAASSFYTDLAKVLVTALFGGLL
jgi:dolichol kinase